MFVIYVGRQFHVLGIEYKVYFLEFSMKNFRLVIIFVR